MPSPHVRAAPIARAQAHRRALRAAAALTLGLAAAATTGGCEQLTDRYCDVFEHTRSCCQRRVGGSYDEASHRCVYAPPPMGPLVPPSERA